MSTGSFIFVERTDDTWARIYCHTDGYLEQNGHVLHNHYGTQKLVEKLVSLGDMSLLEAKCTKPPKGHSFDNRVPGYCVYYGRDRGEKDTGAIIGASLAEVWLNGDEAERFAYVWRVGQGWFIAERMGDMESLKPLAEALAELSTEAA